jgi:hypothetical protein
MRPSTWARTRDPAHQIVRPMASMRVEVDRGEIAEIFPPSEIVVS